MTPLHSLVYKAVDAIAAQIEVLPGGYTFWHRLPAKGRYSRTVIRRHLLHTILAKLFPTDFCRMLLAAVILPTGKPNPASIPLYHWVLHHFYCDNVGAMYADWLAHCKPQT